MELEKIKDKVRKLLALSTSPNESEAVLALEKAQSLMREYHLAESECLYVRQGVKATKRLSRWRSVLAGGVAPLYYCETFRSPDEG
jgi:hypothetical protein